VLLTEAGAHHRIDTRRGMIRTGGEDTVVEYVQAHVAANSEFLVYPYLPIYNYLTATRSPSRYDYFQPGMNTPAQAQEILAVVRSPQTHAVLMEPWFAEKIANSWPGTPVQAIASDPVADYVAKHYRVCKSLTSPDGWRFQYMVKKPDACS
jgi:hypothetical protein